MMHYRHRRRPLCIINRPRTIITRTVILVSSSSRSTNDRRWSTCWHRWHRPRHRQGCRRRCRALRCCRTCHIFRSRRLCLLLVLMLQCWRSSRRWCCLAMRRRRSLIWSCSVESGGSSLCSRRGRSACQRWTWSRFTLIFAPSLR